VSPRIVVADDDPDIRRLIVFTLKRRGYAVREATDGDAALALVSEDVPDLVVLDVMMPGRTGLEVAAALRGAPETAAIPIVMLSAKGQETEVQAGLRSGAQSYLVKPFSPQALAAEVAALLAAAGAEDGPAHGK
jgi:DNA-binding response OmpR family regulator